MPTVSELGHKVKAKYPGAYDDIPDDELGRRVKAKFPGAYDDFSESAPAPPGPPKVAGGYFEGPAKYQENFGGDPLNYVNAVPGVPWKVPLGAAVDAFPAMGGLVFGKALGVPGAAVGGGSMDMLRRSLRGMPIDLKASAIEGGWQGGLQGVAGLAGGLGAASSELIGPAARLAERAAANPVVKAVGKLLPIGGYAGRGIPGAIAGAALPVAGRFALNAAKSPQVGAFLGSMAFRSLARNSPQLAARVIQQLLAEQPDATQTR